MRLLLIALAVFAMTLRAAEPADDPRARAEQLLKENSAADAQTDLERRMSCSKHIDTGKKLMADLEYEEAYKHFQWALADDPRNGDARKLKTQVEALMGVHNARMHTTIELLANQHKVSVEEQKLEIANLIDMAKKHIRIAETQPDLELVERLREYQNALELLLRVKELLNYLPADKTPSTINAQLSDLLRTTQTRSRTVETRQKDAVREDASRESAERCKRR